MNRSLTLPYIVIGSLVLASPVYAGKSAPKEEKKEAPVVDTTPVLYPVVKGEKWGYMDKTGKIVIEPQFEAADSFQEGVAPVKIDGKVGYVDPTGKVVIQPLFDDAYEFKDGVAAVRIGKRWGYIDPTGKYIWEPSK